MNYFSKFLSLFLGIVTLLSCTSTKSIQHNMNSQSYSLDYLMDSRINTTKKDITIKVDSICFNSAGIADSTIVEREKGWFLPLVFIYIWNSKNKCMLGKSMIQEDIPSFLKSSLIKEIDRSGSFYVGPFNDPDYFLELSIDEIGTEGPYWSNGFCYFDFYMYDFSYGDYAGPACSRLKISYKLVKGDEVIHNNSFCSERISEQIKGGYPSLFLLQQDYAISMVEATSFNFKNIIELIVEDLNNYFVE